VVALRGRGGNHFAFESHFKQFTTKTMKTHAAMKIETRSGGKKT